jgi:hypothetical protein
MRAYLFFAAWITVVGFVVCILRTNPLEFSDLSSRDLLEPTVACIGTKDATYGILLTGDSWATGNRFLNDMRNAVTPRLPGRRIEICTIGFSGRNSRRLKAEMPPFFAKVNIQQVFHGRPPDKILLLNGVNDAVLHIGAENYAAYTNEIVTYLHLYTKNVQVVTIPRIKESTPYGDNILSTLKLFLFRCYYDACTYDVIDTYRQALHNAHPLLNVVPYDPFIQTAGVNDTSFIPDGHHLTDAYYHKYGTYLGRAMQLP